MEEEIKQCSMCNELKPKNEYYMLGPKRSGMYHARCKECFKKKQYAYYETVRQDVIDKSNLGYYELIKKIK